MKRTRLSLFTSYPTCSPLRPREEDVQNIYVADSSSSALIANELATNSNTFGYYFGVANELHVFLVASNLQLPSNLQPCVVWYIISTLPPFVSRVRYTRSRGVTIVGLGTG